MNNLNLAANEVALLLNKESKDNKVSFDPATILVIIKILTEVIRLYKGCKANPDDVVKEWNNAGMIKRWKLRRLVSKNLDTNTRKYSKEVYNSVLEYGKNLSTSRGLELYNSVHFSANGNVIS